MCIRDRPEDQAAEDTFTLMAERSLPLIEQTILQAGGSVSGDVWTLPAASSLPPLAFNPLFQMDQRSVNNQILRAGGTIQVSVEGEVAASRTWGIADGVEHNFSGQEQSRRIPRPYQRLVSDGELVVSVVYDRSINVLTIRLIEGSMGGTAIHAEGLFGEEWRSVMDGALLSTTPDPAIPYQIFDIILPESVELSGIRVTIDVGGRLPEASILELDAFFGG